VSNAPWIFLTGSHSGTGNGSIPYGIAVNDGDLRTGTITVANQGITFIQEPSGTNGTPASLSIVSGNNQTGTIGTTFGQKLVVKITGADGNPFAGAAVTFAVASGSASASPTTATSGIDGTAATSVTLSGTTGAIRVTASTPGLPTVTFSANAAPPAPQIQTGGVMSAGLSSPPVQAASPNAIVSVFGQNLAPAGTNRRALPPDLVNGLLPTNFAGVCVLFGNQRAPIFIVTPGQVNVQVPQVHFPSAVAVQVITNCDTPNQALSNPITVPTQASAPEFFYAAQNASGGNPVAAVDGLTGGGIGDPARLGAGFALAYPGEVVVIYATGLGLTTPPFAPGQLATTGAQVSGATVSMDGAAIDPSAVQYAGVVPTEAGLYQLNVVLPISLTPGDHTIAVTVNGASSPSQAYISVATAK
jgi:uncharacterized protein (TIGR03437 family)